MFCFLIDFIGKVNALLSNKKKSHSILMPFDYLRGRITCCFYDKGYCF